MATLINEGDVWQVEVLTKAQEQLGVNVLAFVCTETDNVASDESMAQAAEARFAPLYKALMSVGAAFSGVRVRKMFPVPMPVPTTSGVLSGAGTVPGDILPRQVCGLIKKWTILAGRANQGRVYVPFPSEADSGNTGYPTTDYLTRLQALATAYANGFDADPGGTNCFMSPCLINKDFPAQIPLVSAATARNAWATQRRRGTFGRPNIIV